MSAEEPARLMAPTGIPGVELARTAELLPIERWIIGLLQQDGRMSSSEIARRLSISEPSARRQIQRLVRGRVIAITAVAHPRLLGLRAMAWVGIAVNWPKAADIQASLMEIRGIDYIATTSGRFQIFAEILARDTADLSSRLDLVRALPGVILTETFPYLDLYHQEFRWLGPGRESGEGRRRTGGDQPLSDLERKVVLELRADGRQSFRQIGRAIGAPEHQVRGAYSKLVDRGVLRVMAVLDPARLGIDTMALVGIRVAPSTSVWQVAEALAGHHSVDYVAICTGRFDIIVELASRSRQQLATIIERELGAIEGIAFTELFQYLRLQYRDERVWSVGRVSAVDG